MDQSALSKSDSASRMKKDRAEVETEAVMGDAGCGLDDEDGGGDDVVARLLRCVGGVRLRRSTGSGIKKARGTIRRDTVA